MSTEHIDKTKTNRFALFTRTELAIMYEAIKSRASNNLTAWELFFECGAEFNHRISEAVQDRILGRAE